MSALSVLATLCLAGLVLLWAVICANAGTSYHKIHVIQTAQNTNNRLTEVQPLYFGRYSKSTMAGANFTISVDSATTYQQIIGFGGAFTEAAAYVYSLMNEANKQAIMNAYFGSALENSHQYTICRVHMASCDFSLASYNHDNVTGDYELENFDISHDKKWLIPFIQDAFATMNKAGRSSDELKIFSTPWSPPGWMKTIGRMDSSDMPCLYPQDDIHSAWALYYSKFISAYKEAGINIWATTVQNEEMANQTWESCLYTPQDETNFVRDFLGPRLENDHPEVKIMIWDHNRDYILDHVYSVYSDPEAAKYVDGTAFHWYSIWGGQGYYHNLEIAHNAYPDKFLLATEACWCPGVELGNWNRGETYGQDIISDLNNWATGWVDWNLLLDPQGGPNHVQNYCDAPIIADPQNQVLHFQITYYYLGHFSRFLPPGSTRVQVTTSGVPTTPDNQIWPEFLATSFITPDDKLIVIMLNSADSDASVVLNYAQLGEMGYTLVNAPAHSIQTLVYNLENPTKAVAHKNVVLTPNVKQH